MPPLIQILQIVCSLMSAQSQQQTIYSWNATNVTGWTVISAGTGYSAVAGTTEPCQSMGGDPCFLLNGGAEISTVFSLVGYSDIELWITVSQSGLSTNDYCFISRSTADVTTTQRTNLLSSLDGNQRTLGPVNLFIDTYYSDPADFRISLGNDGADATDECYFDDLQILGTPYTQSPTGAPSQPPTITPTESTPPPSSNPTTVPSESPTKNPTENPSVSPIRNPTVSPTGNPSTLSTPSPTLHIVIKDPTTSPTIPITSTLADDDNDDDEQGDNAPNNAAQTNNGAVYAGISAGVVLLVPCIVIAVCVLKRRNKQDAPLPAAHADRVLSMESRSVAVHEKHAKVDHHDHEKAAEQEVVHDEIEPGTLSQVPTVPRSVEPAGVALMVVDKEIEREDSQEKHVQTRGPPPRNIPPQLSLELEIMESDDEEDVIQRGQTTGGGHTPVDAQEEPAGVDRVHSMLVEDDDEEIDKDGHGTAGWN